MQWIITFTTNNQISTSFAVNGIILTTTTDNIIASTGFYRSFTRKIDNIITSSTFNTTFTLYSSYFTFTLIFSFANRRSEIKEREI
jgi:hypothetical protein